VISSQTIHIPSFVVAVPFLRTVQRTLAILSQIDQ
jgi:hypothetical protein